MWHAPVALSLLAAWLATGCTRPDDGTRSATAGGAIERGAPAAAAAQRAPRELVVRVLDVGQGDAIYVTNGTSRAIVDGGSDAKRFGRLLDSLKVRDTTIDVVILSHAHADHYAGLRELFRSSRGITVRYFFENGDPSSSASLRRLRDSLYARVRRGTLILRDTDDPCGDGRALCTITMKGGAKLHILRPKPGAEGANDRSTPVKIVGPDSASFTMWLAGDAQHGAIDWYRRTGYDARPGMKVHVLKANHHGSCDGVSPWYLSATSPEWLALSLGDRNAYGHMHTQAKTQYARRGIPWYRTDRNGTITFRSPGTPGGGYTVSVTKGVHTEAGTSDRASRDCRR